MVASVSFYNLLSPTRPDKPRNTANCKRNEIPMVDSRLVVRRKIAETLYGEVVECDLILPDDPEGLKPLVVAVKRISLDTASQIQAKHGRGRKLDDPFQELHVARTLMDVDGHPNILYPFSQTVQDGEIYLVYEFCGGGDLFQLLEDSKLGLPEAQTISLMRQVFEGARFLHSSVGVAHRDLSLENVLLGGEDNVCKIADFALSVDVNATPSDERVGKDFYMAPEVVARERYDPVKADIWSLGIMWFILLTGSRLVPIASRSDKSFLALEKHGVELVLEKWGYTDRISRSTIELLARMLAVEPLDRIDLGEILAHSVLI